MIHGSVAGAVLHATPAPVLMVPVGCGEQPLLEGEVVLAPVDGSPFGEAALGHAAELARELCAPLVVFHALPDDPTPSAGPAPTVAATDDVVAVGQRYVDGLAARVRRAGVDARGEVRFEAAASAILGCAQRRRAAAIVMATHGRGDLGRAALGSVASTVLERATRPVLLIHPATATRSLVEDDPATADAAGSAAAPARLGTGER